MRILLPTNWCRSCSRTRSFFLTGTGGLLDADGKLIDSINLSTEFDHLMQQPWINGGMRVKIEQIKDLLDCLPLESSVSITRPSDLAKELFTHKGSGTLVRRGERVLRATSWDELDLPRLKSLIESSFGRTLVPEYFDTTTLLRAYVSENYRAAVILTDEGQFGAGRLTYLDKFAVLDDAQGEGLGRAVWNVMREETPQLFWRSRHKKIRSISFTTPNPTVASSRRSGRCFGTGWRISSRSSIALRIARRVNRPCWAERDDRGGLATTLARTAHLAWTACDLGAVAGGACRWFA